MCEVDRHWTRLPLEEIAHTSRMGNRGFLIGFMGGVIFLNGIAMQDSRKASEHHRSIEFAPSCIDISSIRPTTNSNCSSNPLI